jgi:hypothetical protein
MAGCSKVDAEMTSNAVEGSMPSQGTLEWLGMDPSTALDVIPASTLEQIC